jgi:Domain of unknown function (DUF2019)
MSAADYSRASADDLIQNFIDIANHIGAPTIPGRLKVPPASAVFKQGKDALHAIATELRARNSIPQIRARLFENESLDVRSWASGQFLSSDPTWAFATFCAVLRNMSTQEVVVWRDRILQGPPSWPPLREMTVAQLVQRFVDACERCFGTTRFLLEDEGGGDTRQAYNNAAGEIHAIAKEIYAQGELHALVPLLDHPFVTVRQRAAMYCLKIAADKAVPTLEAIDATGEVKEGVEANVILAL